MERKTFTDDFAGSIEMGDRTEIQDLITELIDFKRDKRKEGWSDITVALLSGGLMLYGNRKETDEEMERRSKDMDMYAEMSTHDLLAKLKKARIYESSYTVSNIKDALEFRGHVPNRIERKVIRQLQARTGISDLEELREKYGKEIADKVKEGQ